MIKAEYIESGTFVCGEEEVFHAGIKPGDEAIILSQEEFNENVNMLKMQTSQNEVITLLKQDYSDESSIDIERDVYEALSEDYNPLIKTLPKDEHNFKKGTFRVTVEWIADNE